jgi:hypothetical protein
MSPKEQCETILKQWKDHERDVDIWRVPALLELMQEMADGLKFIGNGYDYHEARIVCNELLKKWNETKGNK